MNQLTTKWGREVNAENVLPEYPRPALVRERWRSLNGLWEYAIAEENGADAKRAFTSCDAGAAKTAQTAAAETKCGVPPVMRPGRWDGQILVPFSPESALSGVQRTVRPGQALFYRRQFALPEEFGDGRVLLHFGAVDQECAVYVDNVPVGTHAGGYLPFTCDITAALGAAQTESAAAQGSMEFAEVAAAAQGRVEAAEVAAAAQGSAEAVGNAAARHELLVRVTDWTEQRPHARGKQRLGRGQFPALFYTPQSGIWQTVWLESVPERYIEALRITPLYDESAVRIEARLCGRRAECALARDEMRFDGESTARRGEQRGRQSTVQEKTAETLSVTIFDGGRPVAQARGAAGEPLTISLPDFCPWSPEEPHLYEAEARLCGAAVSMRKAPDRVRSYFGMRKVEARRDRHGVPRFFVNGKPYFFNGVLDQGYWPESLMTPPSDEALEADLRLVKRLGFNTVRKHVKIESERFYYHCDRIGLFVWQDMPNGGGLYQMAFTTVLPNLLGRLVRRIGDGAAHYRLFRREDAQGRRQYRADLQAMAARLYNFPCIAVWVPFNEGWGQFDAREATALLRREGGARLVNEACGWFDQGGGDMYSIHNYMRRLRVRPQPERVVALTEYGGYAWPVAGHLFCEQKFGYRHYRSRAELTAAYERLLSREIVPNLRRGLCSAIYTQLSDIESEINGLVTYDRAVEKMDGARVAAANRAVREAFEKAAEQSS